MHIPKQLPLQVCSVSGFGAVQRAYTKLPLLSYEETMRFGVIQILHIPKLMRRMSKLQSWFGAVQKSIYHIPKRTDNAHMKERFGTVQKTHIPKRLYADKLCLERFGAVQKTRIPKLQR